jgi:hypothetical protein
MNAVVNPFAGEKESRAITNAAANSDGQRAVAEVQAAMMIARANPRDQLAAMDRILNACTRPSLADAAVYTYAKGGSDVSGPSIRLAEAIAQSWGNMQFGIRELDQSSGESTVQAYAWDVETNTRREITFQVPHIRFTKKGSYDLADPREIYELVANQGSRRLRACILAVIPGDVTEAAVSQCEMTMKTKADTSPEAMKKMVDAFSPFGVTREQIEGRIQRKIDAIQPAQVVALKKIYASLRDGMSSPKDWFDVPDDAASIPVPQPKAKATVKEPVKTEPEQVSDAPNVPAEAKPASTKTAEGMATAEQVSKMNSLIKLKRLDKVEVFQGAGCTYNGDDQITVDQFTAVMDCINNV